jgi:hypothetical protein
LNPKSQEEKGKGSSSGGGLDAIAVSGLSIVPNIGSSRAQRHIETCTVADIVLE